MKHRRQELLAPIHGATGAALGHAGRRPLQLPRCSANAVCHDAYGGRGCTCVQGYSGDGVTCSVIDECATNNGGCPLEATCINFVGGRICSCKQGDTGDGLFCSDVDECATNSGGRLGTVKVDR